MIPRNITLFRFSDAVSRDLASQGIAEQLAEYRVREPGPVEAVTSGFASPFGATDERMTIATNDCIAFVWQQYQRVLPAAAVNAEVEKKLRKVAEEEGRGIGRKERRRMREDVLNAMLPHAPVMPRRVSAWLDTANGWLVVDTSSRRVAEMVVTALREVFGSFPAVPPAPEESPRVLLTDWLANDTLPSAIALGDECELRDLATATGAMVRCRNQDLDSEEVKEHLRNGKQVFQLGLVFAERMELVLSEFLAIKGLKPLDILTDTREQAESDEDQRRSDLTLATLEVGQLLSFLERTFAIPRPTGA
ncbi:recombination-associated protein RdgC [Dyella sp. ASV21]|uniref:recombination-associated protein RdgC n=1 Tax=Dyella sp. ASV21 TaxID=2795114 RepID=UPI0018ED4B49|nr:recombination-associated protein RdgC [Dyella sp. ASV21]